MKIYHKPTENIVGIVNELQVIYSRGGRYVASVSYRLTVFHRRPSLVIESF